MSHKLFRSPGLLAALALLSGAVTSSTAAEMGVQMIQTNDHVRVEINGELFTQYWFTGKLHPAITTKKAADGGVTSITNPAKHVYFWPLLGPGGAPMTRNWPMKETEGEERDHQHHRSLWFSHGAVNGVDFWAEDGKAGRIKHDKFLEVKSGKDEGVLRSACSWVAPDGKVACTDERTFRVYNRPNSERVFDFEITLFAPKDREALFGDTKEGSMAIRVNEEMRVNQPKRQPGKGHIVLSTGVKDEATWGKSAAWCDYYGPVNGKTVGIAIFDHPSNPVHPTYWHVRDYGLFAANPFGIHDFEKKPPGTGNLTIPAGKSVTFKYRFYLHEGDDQSAKVAERYKEYTAATEKK